MKKRLMIVLCSAMLFSGAAVPAMAAISPTGQRDTTETTDKAATAPKTGEGDFALYALAGAALLGGTALVTGTKLKKNS